MKLTLSTIAAILLRATVPAFAASVIDFDDLPDQGATLRYIPSDHYAALGVLFNQDIPLGNVAAAGWPPTLWASRGGTPPNFLILYRQSAGGPGLAIEMTFVVPGTSIPATTDYISALFGDSEVGSTLGTLQAFDAKGALLATRTVLTPLEEAFRLEIRSKGIARVRFSVDEDGGVIDNITFNTPGCPASSIRVSEVAVCWDSILNGLYRIDYRDSLPNAPWQPLRTGIVGTGQEMCEYDKIAPGQQQRFYQVVCLSDIAVP